MVAGVTEGAPARAWGQTSATSTVDVRQAIKPINPPGMQTLPGCGSRLRALLVDRNIAVVDPLLIHPLCRAVPFRSAAQKATLLSLLLQAAPVLSRCGRGSPIVSIERSGFLHKGFNVGLAILSLGATREDSL